MEKIIVTRIGGSIYDPGKCLGMVLVKTAVNLEQDGSMKIELHFDWGPVGIDTLNEACDNAGAQFFHESQIQPTTN